MLLFWLLRIFIFFWLLHAFHEIRFFISLFFSGVFIDFHLLHTSCYGCGKHVIFVVTKAFAQEHGAVSVFRNLDRFVFVIFYFYFTFFCVVSRLSNRLSVIMVLMVIMATLTILRISLMFMLLFLWR